MFDGPLEPVARRETFTETLDLIDENDEPFDLDGATVQLLVCDREECGPVLSASLDNGVTITGPGQITWRFEAGALSRFAPGMKRLTILVSRGGDTVQVLAADLPILE